MKKKVSEKQRRLGEFYTPTAFVDLAHKYIADTFGSDWKEKYVVWDPAWGTGNLTRDYKFKELYCSTIEASDIHTANQMGYNPEAIKFQFDFLNDEDSALPKSLQDAINSGKEILFLINPPYATANDQDNISSEKTKHKKGVGDTKIVKQMKNENWGESTRNLYSQFLYKIFQYQKNNKNIKIGIFCPPLFLTGNTYLKFREKFLLNFLYKNGFLFEARHFSDVAKNWGISFTIFNNEYKKNNNFNIDVIDYNKNFELNVVGNKTFYNTDTLTESSEWIRKSNIGKKLIETIQLKTGLSSGSSNVNKIVKNSIGYLLIQSNKISSNTSQVSLYTSATSNRGGVSLDNDNFLNGISLFAARKTIQPTWINCKDEYLAPNEQHPKFEQFKYDSLVYSLFNNSSQQSSLRQVEYKDKLWDIKNEFFWLSKDKMKQLAEENDFDALYQDARTSDERYVYELLFGEQNIYSKLSPDAKAVLDAATELMEKSMKMRKVMSEEHPEYHLNSWDAGWSQIKLVTKQYFKNEFDAFRALYKKFEDRMRPFVYELGFLLDIKE